ncbi:MAG: CdaR family protein [Fimbriimonadaceae bacterium]
MTKPVLLLVAFALSLVLYLYVQSQTAPNGSETLQLVVHSKGLSPELLFDEEDGTVSYEADGPRDKLDRLVAGLKDNPQFITAVANLSAISPRNVRDKVHVDNVHLVVQPTSELAGIELRQLQRLDGVVERPKTRDVKVRVDFPSPPTPNAWADYDRNSFEPFPDTVTLTGPASDVNIATLTVVVNPAEAEETGVVRVRLSIPHNLTSNPRVDYVDVRPTRRERQAYVNVSFTGHLPAGYMISNYYVVTAAGPSSTAAIRGPSGIVDKTSAIEATVDISGLKAGWTFTEMPKMPRLVELVNSPLRIRVDVEKTRR